MGGISGVEYGCLANINEIFAFPNVYTINLKIEKNLWGQNLIVWGQLIERMYLLGYSKNIINDVRIIALWVLNQFKDFPAQKQSKGCNYEEKKCKNKEHNRPFGIANFK